jgi:hypothetical protein
MTGQANRRPRNQAKVHFIRSPFVFHDACPQARIDTIQITAKQTALKQGRFVVSIISARWSRTCDTTRIRLLCVVAPAPDPLQDPFGSAFSGALVPMRFL